MIRKQGSGHLLEGRFYKLGFSNLDQLNLNKLDRVDNSFINLLII